MREITFELDCCKGEAAKFSGTVTMQIPSFSQRYEIISQSGLVQQGEGEIRHENVEGLIKVVDKAMPLIKAVNLVKLDGMVEIKSVDDLIYDSACDVVLFEIGAKILNGFSPEKK